MLDRENLFRLNRATGIPGLNREDVYALTRPVPPLPEQQAIAAVLDSIDDAIEGAKAVIAATEELRDSLLHELIIRGVPGWHTEWKEVPGLGTIPADWEVATLQRGVDLPVQDRIHGTVPLYGSNGILDYHSHAAQNGARCDHWA